MSATEESARPPTRRAVGTVGDMLTAGAYHPDLDLSFSTSKLLVENHPERD
jgi:hypothetical protein